jgi:hypothetical protein
MTHIPHEEEREDNSSAAVEENAELFAHTVIPTSRPIIAHLAPLQRTCMNVLQGAKAFVGAGQAGRRYSVSMSGLT